MCILCNGKKVIIFCVHGRACFVDRMDLHIDFIGWTARHFLISWAKQYRLADTHPDPHE